MSRNLPTVIAAIVLLGVLVVYMITYQVGFTDRVVVTTFGKPYQRSDVVVERVGEDRAAVEQALSQAGVTGDQAARVLDHSGFVPDLSPDAAVALKQQLEAAGAAARTRQTAGQPGWNLKWPWPVQNVIRYDGRVQVLEDTEEETLTADGKNIIVVTYCGWRIDDALKFSQRIRKINQASKSLNEQIRSAKRAVIGTYMLDDFVSLDRDALQARYDKIEQDIFDRARATALAEYGIDVVALGIRRISLPTNVSEKVFQQMRETRQKQAATTRAEGQAEADRIVAKADSAKRTILAFAQTVADQIRSEGYAAAAKHYEAFRENPEFARFLDEMEFLKKTLHDETTFVMDWQTPIFKYFQDDQNMLDSFLGASTDQSPAEEVSQATEPPARSEP